MKSLLLKFRDRWFAPLATKEDIQHLYDQFAGLLQIQNAIKGEPVLRPMRGWAISPDAMTWILAELQERPSATVIEFGSGQSTIILAAVLKRLQGRLISVEHDPEYFSIIRRQAEACGVADVIEYVHSPLIKIDDQCRSYDVSAIPARSVDVALIDGPPTTNGLLTRFIPLRWAAENLAGGGVIFLDDSARNSERECLKKLIGIYPDLVYSEKSAEKGILEVRLPKRVTA